MTNQNLQQKAKYHIWNPSKMENKFLLDTGADKGKEKFGE